MDFRIEIHFGQIGHSRGISDLSKMERGSHWATYLNRHYKKAGLAFSGRSEMLQMLHNFGILERVTFMANETNETQKRGVSKASHLRPRLGFNQEKYGL